MSSDSATKPKKGAPGASARSDNAKKAAEILNRYIASKPEGEHYLYPMQLDSLNALQRLFEEGKSLGYFSLPTGFGKTVIFTAFIEALLRHGDSGQEPAPKVLVVEPRMKLVTQTRDRIREFVPDADIGMWYSNSKDEGNAIMITTYQSLLKGHDFSDYGIVILDEAHHLLSNKTGRLISGWMEGNAKDRIMIGFTATPEYSPEKSLKDVLVNEVHRVSIREAAAEGLLAEHIIPYVIKTDVDLGNVRVDVHGMYNLDEVSKLINNETINDATLKFYKQELANTRTIVFCPSVEHAKALASKFSENGIRAREIDGDMEEEEQNGILEGFGRGDTDVLFNVKMLVEGFDDKGVEAAIFTYNVQSPLFLMQAAGRTTRKMEDKEKHVKLVQFYHKTPRGRNVTPSVFISDILEGGEATGRGKEGGRYGSEGILEKPRDDREIKIEGVEVIIDVQKMREINAEARKSDGQAYDEKRAAGWRGIGEVRAAIGVRTKGESDDCHRNEELIREEHGGWAMRLRVDGKRVEIVSPEFAMMLEKMFYRVPKGWKSSEELAKGLGLKDDLKILEYLDSKEKPPGCGYSPLFLKTAGRRMNFINPALEAFIRQGIGKAQPGPAVQGKEGHIFIPMRTVYRDVLAMFDEEDNMGVSEVDAMIRAARISVVKKTVIEGGRFTQMNFIDNDENERLVSYVATNMKDLKRRTYVHVPKRDAEEHNAAQQAVNVTLANEFVSRLKKKFAREGLSQMAIFRAVRRLQEEAGLQRVSIWSAGAGLRGVDNDIAQKVEAYFDKAREELDGMVKVKTLAAEMRIKEGALNTMLGIVGGISYASAFNDRMQGYCKREIADHLTVLSGNRFRRMMELGIAYENVVSLEELEYVFKGIAPEELARVAGRSSPGRISLPSTLAQGFYSDDIVAKIEKYVNYGKGIPQNYVSMADIANKAGITGDEEKHVLENALESLSHNDFSSRITGSFFVHDRRIEFCIEERDAERAAVIAALAKEVAGEFGAYPDAAAQIRNLSNAENYGGQVQVLELGKLVFAMLPPEMFSSVENAGDPLKLRFLRIEPEKMRVDDKNGEGKSDVVEVIGRADAVQVLEYFGRVRLDCESSAVEMRYIRKLMLRRSQT